MRVLSHTDERLGPKPFLFAPAPVAAGLVFQARARPERPTSRTFGLKNHFAQVLQNSPVVEFLGSTDFGELSRVELAEVRNSNSRLAESNPDLLL